MTKLVQYLFLVAILLITIAAFSPAKESKKEQLDRLTPPSTALAPSATAEAQQTQTCLSEGELQAILGRQYLLVNEQYSEELQRLECAYAAPEMVKGIQPSVRYSLTQTHDPSAWEYALNITKAKPSHRLISEKEYLIADVNPVFELNQVVFYGFLNGHYIELSYSPVKEEVGQLLDKGMKLSDNLLVKKE